MRLIDADKDCAYLNTASAIDSAIEIVKRGGRNGARNRYPGTCYCCGNWVPTGFGHFERHNGGWRIKCVKCASGRPVIGSDREVKRAIKLRDEELRRKRGGRDERQ